MKIIFTLAVIILFCYCDNKKSKLDDLNSKKSEIKKQIDSFTHLQNVLLEKAEPGNLDTTILNKSTHYSAQITILQYQLKKIDFSIDSLSKY